MAVTTGTMMAVSAGVSVAGQLAQGMAARRAGDMQAQMDERLARQQQDQAQQEADRIRRAGAKTKGAARAQLAASGINANQGSSVAIEDEIGTQSEQDARMTLLTGQRYADASRFAGAQARMRGKSALAASALGATSTGLQGWKGVAREAPVVTDGGYSVGQGGSYGTRRGM